MTWDGVKRRESDGIVESLRQEVSSLLVSNGRIEAELRHLNEHNTAFRDELNREIAKITVTLNGNGHPENGLIYKAERNTEFRLFFQRFGWIILAGFAGVPCTVVAGLVLYFIKGG